MLLACAMCAPPCRQAAAEGASLGDMQTAAAEGRLHQLALDIILAQSLYREEPAPPAERPAARSGGDAGSGSSGTTRPSSELDNNSDSGGAAPKAPGSRLDTLVRTALAMADGGKRGSGSDALGTESGSAGGAVPAGRKMCNLCREVQHFSRFPLAGERLKPYCSSCMPAVRKGSLMGIRVAELRGALQSGGMNALHNLLHT